MHRSLSNTNVGAGAAIANAGAGRSMLRRGDQTQALTQAQAHQAADGNLVKPPLPQPQQQRKKNKVAGQEKGLRIGGKENDLSSSVVPSPAQSTKAATVVYGSASAAESAPRSIGSNGDYIGREIDALSLRIRQRLAAI